MNIFSHGYNILSANKSVFNLITCNKVFNIFPIIIMADSHAVCVAVVRHNYTITRSIMYSFSTLNLQ